MSLSSLTFGNNGAGFTNKAYFQGTVLGAKAAKIKVKKACKFFNCDDLYLIGEVMSGTVAESMKGQFKGAPIQITQVESKAGNKALKGYLAGFLVSGLTEEMVQSGDEVEVQF
ncbi:MAG: hypothetical protein HY917_05480 [Candidatus Diapherotrites archaeon]|nr:hypothetical protein [Candidatus Diapherotrites archaeon]